MRRAALVLAAFAAAGLSARSLRAQAAPEAPADGAYARVGAPSALSDTTLARLVDEALEANPDLAAVEARIQGARAERFQTALDLAPAVTASGGYTRQRISGASFPGLTGTLPDQDVWEAGLHMSWEVDAFGRIRRSLDGRADLLDAAEEDVQDARVVLGAEVAGAYYRVRGAQDRLAVALRNAENQRRTLAVTQERLEAGRGTALDTERARAQLSSTLSAIPALEASVIAEQHRLSVLLGREPGVVVEDLPPGAAAPVLPETLEAVEPDALALGRPDVLGAEHRVAASEAFVGAAKAAYLPRITLQGAAGYTASAFDALGNTGTPRYAIGPVLSWPLLDLARVKSGVDRAKAAQTEARARYQGALLRATEEIETSRARYEGARARLGHLEDAAAASARAADLARLRFEEGAGDFLEVLDAERRLLEAEDRLAAGRTDATTALVAAYRAMGVTWTGGDERASVRRDE